MKNQFIISLRIFALTLFLTSHISLYGQSYYSKDEPEKGYWQVYTDLKTSSTIVQFFDATHQLMYKETMPRKFIKLSKRNIRQFDDLLAKLMTKNLLTSSVKSFDLVADSRTTFRDISSPEMASPSMPSSHQTKETNIYLIKGGRLKIILKNSYQEHFAITIFDEELRIVYREPIDDVGYGRWFDVSRLAEGNYRIRIDGPRNKLFYKLAVNGQSGFSLTDLN